MTFDERKRVSEMTDAAVWWQHMPRCRACDAGLNSLAYHDCQHKWVEVASYQNGDRLMRLFRKDSEWRMTGSPYGDHSLSDASDTRAMAHWQGYRHQTR
jgi:hypothetical protein